MPEHFVAMLDSAWPTPGGYFGTGELGNVTISSLTSITPPNPVNSYDADMVVLNYSSLDITSSGTLTTSQPCRGMLVYVAGNCTISGKLSMTQRGAAANPTVSGASDNSAVPAEGLRFPFLTASGSDSLVVSDSLLAGCGTAARSAIANHSNLSSNGTIVTISRAGAAGGARVSGGTPISPNDGSSGATGQSGGGGSGGGYYQQSTVGAGSSGTCFSGGSGGGGSHGGSASDAAQYGGAGGNPSGSDNGFPTPGGIGNPNGTWSSGGYVANGIDNSEGGTGGLLVLIVGGTLTINSGGSIQANGFSGPNFSNANRGGGGASGGGNVVVAYKGGMLNNGSITANGGARWGWANSQIGGAGGNGSVQILQVK